MRISLLVSALVAVYVVASIGYVYHSRGRSRYACVARYLCSSTALLAPFNGVFYLAARRAARQPVLDAGYVHGTTLLREHWAPLRDEAVALQLAGNCDARTAQRLIEHHQLGFRRFSQRNWHAFHLTWQGIPLRSARRLCPNSVRLLERIPAIRSAMFCVLPADAELDLQADALACTLRYHLGLETPGSERCFINVDGVSLSWHNGEDFVLDGTYPYYARNATGVRRVILLCDVARPMNRLGQLLAAVYGQLMRMLAPSNTAEDRRGPWEWLPTAAVPWQWTTASPAPLNRAATPLLKLSFDLLFVALALRVHHLFMTLDLAILPLLRWPQG